MQKNRFQFQKLKRPLGYALLSLAALLLLAIICFFIFRTSILHYTVEKVRAKFDARYPAKLHIASAEFSGLASVTLTGISIKPNNAPQLMQADSVYTSVDIWKLLVGRVAFSELNIANASVTPVKQDSTDNFSFLLKRQQTQDTPRDTTFEGTDYGRLINRVIEATFDLIPEKARFRNLTVDFLNNGRHIQAEMPFLNIRDRELHSEIVYFSDSVTTRLIMKGQIDNSAETISGMMYAADTGGIWVPYIQQKAGARMHFDTLRFALDEKTYRNGVLNIQGEAAISDLVLFHERLALTDIRIRNGSTKYRISVGPKWVSLDTLSEVTVNEMTFMPQLRYEKLPDNKEISAQIVSKKTPAQDFFNSLPQGLFDNLQGIKATGALTYKLQFHVNTSQLDSLEFDSDLEAENLEITGWGETNLQKINGTFEHTVYEFGKEARTFTVGPSNPFYTPIQEVSPHLRNSILTAEDYGFYRHKGFHEEAFRKAIITNIKEKRFARGGSTLTMQLVKNVFLSRNKTVSRKIEEALIVWLIENQRLVGKQRLFEVYLNIIEWGPYIYGIKDASRFYFAKQPADLTLAEAIFLTKIIPSPKNFRSLFDAYGRLKPWNGAYFRMIGGIMKRRGLITEEEHAALVPQVYLRGRARDIVVTATDVPPDSILYGAPQDSTAIPSGQQLDLEDLKLKSMPMATPTEAEAEKPKKKLRLWPFGKRKDKE